MHCPKCGEALDQKDETNGGIHRCPVCAEAMVRKTYPAMQHTALDFCWACQSAWFDRGELNKDKK